MKCWVLVIRSLRSRCFLYIVIFLCILYVCKVYQNKRSISVRSMFYNFPYLDSSNFFFRRSFFDNYNQFAPGAFLKQLKPSNESYCNFRLGFPDYFDLSDSEINFSPELGEKSPYRVIYNVLQGSWTRNNSNSVTYSSHLTPEFLYYLVEIVIRWEGPISIAAFVPSYDASTTLCLLQRLCFCVPEMSKVSLHFVFPIEYPPDHLVCNPALYVPKGCSIPAVISSRRLNTFRNKEELIYPVNVARNVARTRANTRFVLVSDIELIPSKQLVSRFERMLSRFHLRSDKNTPLKHLVYVVPVFEVEHYISNIPEKKSELLYLYSQNRAIYFHRWICLHCQRFPGLQRWIHHSSSTTDSSIQPMLVVRREFPYHRWEPIYIGTNEEPLYSELLSWEGKQDKMAQMHEMCLLGYRFVILDGAFLVHAPGIKRHPGPRSEIQTAQHFNNMRHYDEIMRAVTARLGSKQGCKVH